jgi:hypothetical protein
MRSKSQALKISKNTLLGNQIKSEDKLVFYSKVAEVDRHGNLDGEDTSTSEQNSQDQN